MNDKQLAELRDLYADWKDYEIAVHGGTGTAAKNLGCYRDKHREFQDFLADDFSAFLDQIEHLQSALDVSKAECEVISSDDNNYHFCDGCNKEVFSGDSYCHTCGAKLQWRGVPKEDV